MSKYYNEQDPFYNKGEKTKEVILVVVIVIAIIGGLIGLSFGMGWINVGYKNTVGVADANADRNVFKENKSYVEGMVSDLSKYRYELSTEKDQIARKAIVQLINSKFANFDINKIEDNDLQSFLKDIKSGKYNDGGVN